MLPTLINRAEVQAVLTLFVSILVLVLSAYSLLLPSFIWIWISSGYIHIFLYCIFVALLMRWCARGGRCSEIDTANLDGQTYLITGAGGGIGKVTAKELAKRGARVVLFARGRNLAEVISDVKKVARSANNVVGYAIDLSDLQSIKSCVDEFMTKENENNKITALINNAGIGACPYSKTKDGLELLMGTNHFGHFYLTKLLLSRLHSSRIVNVSSSGHALWHVPCDATHYLQMCQPDMYKSWKAYSLSKSANILFTRELQRRYFPTYQIRAYSLHPGLVDTDIFRHMGISDLLRTLIQPFRYLVMKTPLEGAQTNLYCTLSNQAKPGEYHVDCRPVSVQNKYAKDDNVAREWWDYSEKIINEKLMNIDKK